MSKVMYVFMILALVCQFTSAQQTTEYLTAEIPMGCKPASSVVTVKWVGVARPTFKAPDSGSIYYDRSPGGGKLSNYRYKVTKFAIDTTVRKDSVNNNYLDEKQSPSRRIISFKPIEQGDMRSGVFYCVIAFPFQVGALKDTFVSNEFQLFIESPDAAELIGPKDTINDLTPTFSWKANAGVPYYHVILSDQKIATEEGDSGKVDVSGLSIIWQAITPNTQIVYGTPDPLKLTPNPPPLSPGANYTWLVLNNYGNHPAFSSTVINLPGEFTLRGLPLKTPKNVYPSNGTKLTNLLNKKFNFKWTNIDTNANTYKIYVYVGSTFEGIEAQMSVWQTEVTAARVDTMSAEIDAASVLTSNHYTWRVIAIDNKGAGTAGDTTGFDYSAPTGTIDIHTRENIKVKVGDAIQTVVSEIGLVEIKVEVLEGSLEAPLLFYTDTKGNLSRSRPTGSYRLTAIKEGFKSQSKTVTLTENAKLDVTFFLERPEATVYGKVLDEALKGINLATVRAVSDRNDTVTAKTDAIGNFSLNCYGADWTIGAEIVGYKAVVPKKITVQYGENLNFGNIVLERNPFTLSGVVKNSLGVNLLGATVRLYQSGRLIDELPSTPQTGGFSFTVPPGDYTVTVDKTGFSSYSGLVNLLSSKSITVTLTPGATLVTGYVVGKTWVHERNDYVFAPITKAQVSFVKVSGTKDTTSVQSDAIYGDYKVSLPGLETFNVLVSANGYAAQKVIKSCTTAVKTTQYFNDTLQALGMVFGYTKLKGTGQIEGGLQISLINKVTGAITASTKSSVLGYFEIRNIPDGSYNIKAGKEGFVVDSIIGGDTLNLLNGKPSNNDITIYSKVGDKTVKFKVQSASAFTGSIKIQSPILRTITPTDSLSKVGPGQYIITVDAAVDSLVDLAYHSFAVADSEVVHIDSPAMFVKHKRSDTLTPSLGIVSLVLTSQSELDSAIIYYKDISMQNFLSKKISNKLSSYTFLVEPPKDGSTMMYYFRAFKGTDIYGYDKEVRSVFVKPDISRLTKFEISPASSDTLVFPSNYEISYLFRGYYSSAYIENTSIDPNSISWSLADGQGCQVITAKGLATKIKTGNTKTNAPVKVIATIDTTKTKVTSTAGISDTVYIKVSGSELTFIKVNRVDGKNPNPISTSPTERAEFKAVGYDADSATLTVSPTWSISPSFAGTISSDGTFKPNKNFIGYVRIIATSGNVIGEYNPKSTDKKDYGLNVQFLISCKETPDTATSAQGATVIFPAKVVDGSDLGLLDLSAQSFTNKVNRGLDQYRMIDSTAFEITQIENVSLILGTDSIKLYLTIPDAIRPQVKNGKMVPKIAYWNPDSLFWEVLPNSIISNDASTVSTKLGHFSRYTLVAEPGEFSVSFTVTPNPFSPFVKSPMPNIPTGTNMQIRVEGTDLTYRDATVRIYNVVGDLVWAVGLKNFMAGVQYNVYWDGRTTEREMSNLIGTTVQFKGHNMCRNGRYFAVLTLHDMKNRKKTYMRQIVLIR